MDKNKSVMLSIILIAVSIGTISLALPLSVSTPLEAFEAGVTSSSTEPTEPTKPGVEGGGIAGWVIIEVYDKFGEQKYYSSNHNLIVDEGNQVASDLIFGTTLTSGESAGEMTFIQLGTGTTNPAVGDTNCETPAGSKIDDTAVVNHPTLEGAILNATGNFGNQLIGLSISEICLTDSGTNATGNLFARQEFTPFTFNSGDTVNATWTITFVDSDGT